MARSVVLNAAVRISMTSTACAKSDAPSLPAESERTGAVHPQHPAIVWERFVRPVLPALVAVYVPLLLLLAVARWVFLAHASDVVEPLRFDIEAMFSHSTFTMLDVAGWTLALVVALVAARRATRDGRTARARLLAGAALLSALFLLDDVFQLHKPVVPEWVGVPSVAVLCVYACALAIWLWTCRREIAQTDLAILVLTLAFFATWFGCKASSPFAARTSMEISLKLCGVAGWALYVFRASKSGTSRVPRES
jgi:hypothetical protein